ncbi:MAG: prepilin peptidase [Clostridiales bacterium]|nr:prepilin peptidase [Clostridiales bacterium]
MTNQEIKGNIWNIEMRIGDYHGGGHRIIKSTVLIILLVLATVSDFKTYRIPNKLILSGLVISFYFQFLEGSFLSVLYSLGILLLICIVFLPIYYIRAIGAGDIKLFAMISCFVGMKQGIQVIIVAFIIGGVFSIVKLFYYHIFRSQLQSLAEYITQTYYLKKIVPYSSISSKKKNVIHFSFPILLSTILIIGGDFISLNVLLF